MLLELRTLELRTLELRTLELLLNLELRTPELGPVIVGKLAPGKPILHLMSLVRSYR